MGTLPKDRLTIDPRTKILLLVAVSMFIFSNAGVKAEIGVLLFLSLLAIALGIGKTAIKGAVFFLTAYLITYIVLPLLPALIAKNFTIVLVTFLKLLPCFLAGQIIVKTTPIRIIMYALEKMHLPHTFAIPLAVSLRYFPALAEEWQALSDAVKLRNIKGLAKLEFMFVPLMITASKTADELSQAIIARGIDNPVQKTCAIELSFRAFDFLILGIALLMMSAVLLRPFIEVFYG